MKQFFLSSIIISLLFFSCSKNKNDCWQAVETNGAVVNGLVLCGVSKAEAESKYPQYWFYNTDEPIYCWRVANTNSTTIYYTANLPQSIMAKLYQYGNATYDKIACNSYCTWKILEKHKSKTTGLFNSTRLYIETYTTDTCSKLFVGKIVTYRETIDSLITREYSEKTH